MIKFRNMMEIVINGQDSIICAVKEANGRTPTCIDELLLDGKYWIRKKENGEIVPAIPDELMEADSAMGLGTNADYLIFVPNFDQDVYWRTTTLNAPFFVKRASS